MKISNIYAVIIMLMCCGYLFGQKSHQHFMRPISGINTQWHKIILPNAVITKLSNNLSSIRVMGITAAGDTIFAPYLIQTANEESTYFSFPFNLINQSENKGKYYYTFEPIGDKVVNQINLEFGQKNYDWLATVEGSHDMKDWFTIADNYRLLSISNDVADYSFNQIVFPDSKYKYLRVAIKSKEKPSFINASLNLHEFTSGKYQSHIHSTSASYDLQNKSSVLLVNLAEPLPINKIKIAVKNKYDYYRPIAIDYLSDSVRTEKGWIYNYESLMNSTINSFEKSEYSFNTTFTNRIKIIIPNRDNTPLDIDSIQILGPIHELITRIDKAGEYYLTYSNMTSEKPSYDITHFVDKVPDSISTLRLGNEVLVKEIVEIKKAPYFQNKMWMWSLMLVIIAMIAWFSYKMIRHIK